MRPTKPNRKPVEYHNPKEKQTNLSFCGNNIHILIKMGSVMKGLEVENIGLKFWYCYLLLNWH